MLHDTDDVSTSLTHMSANLQKRVINRIHPFHILCIYDTHEAQDHLKRYAKNVFFGEKDDLSLFSHEHEGKSFIISQTSYQQNNEIFYSIRTRAREDVFNRIATGVTAYFFKKYAHLIESSMLQHQELRDPQLLNTSVQKIKILLKKNTFLAEETAWNTFYNWFKNDLTYYAVNELEHELGQNKLERMDQKDLNDLILQRLTQQVRIDSSLMTYFIKTVEQYLQQWIDQIIPVLDQRNFSSSQLETFLGVGHDRIHKTVTMPALPINVTEGHLSVMSNAVYQAVRETLSHHCFQHYNSVPWPTVAVRKGTVEGKIQMIPYGSDGNPDQTQVDRSWKQKESLSELDADVLDALCSFFISNAVHHQGVVEINVQDLLEIRGLKSKRSGNMRRGGYEPEQVQQILKALTNIQDIWTEFDKVVIYDKGKPTEVTLSGRPFLFLDSHQQICDVSKCDKTDKLLFTAGDMFYRFLRGSGRQIALLPLKALQYNPYQQQWEKRLIRYLSWRWRTQARKKDYHQPHKIGSLLQAIDKDVNTRTPSRTRERMEQALDRLQDDGLVGSWEYLEWDETLADSNGWVRLWENTKVVISPPEVVKEQYQVITKKGGNLKRKAQKSEQRFLLGIQLREYREKLGLTIVQTAKELDLSAAYISSIERGKRVPSAYVSEKIGKWIQQE